MNGAQAPYSEDAEQAVLGGVFQDGRYLIDLRAMLTPADFFLRRNMLVAEAVFALAERNDAVDMVTVAGELRRRGSFDEVGGNTYLAQLMGSVFSVKNMLTYAKQVADTAYQRRLLEAADKLRTLALSSSVTRDERRESAVALVSSADQQSNDEEIVSLADEILLYMEEVEASVGQPVGYSGLETGFYDFDDLTDGLQAGSLNLLAGRPGMGKTAAIMAIALNAARRGKKVYFWSGEMPRKQLRERVMAVETAINSKKLRRGLRANGMDDADWSKFVEASGRLGKLAIWMDTIGNCTPTILQSRIERLARRLGGLDLIIIDYIGLMKPGIKAQNRNLELGYISNYLKQNTSRVAPVLAAAQLSRKCEERTDKRPVLSDLRDSGELENDADTVTFMYRDVVYNEQTDSPNAAELIVAKNRHGDVGTVQLYFEKSLTKLTNAARTRIDLREL